MTEYQVLQYARFVAVGNGTLAKSMNDRLGAGDRQLAIDIMNGRFANFKTERWWGSDRT